MGIWQTPVKKSKNQKVSTKNKFKIKKLSLKILKKEWNKKKVQKNSPKFNKLLKFPNDNLMKTDFQMHKLKKLAKTSII